MFLLPSLNRPELLKKVCASALQTNCSSECMILIDDKDWWSNLAAYEAIKKPMSWSFRVVQGITMGEKVAEVWSMLDGSDTVGIINDDFEFITDEWDKKLLKYLDGKNFVSSNDRKLRSWIKPSGVTVWSKPLLDVLGWKSFFPPGMQHLFIDDVWLQLGNATGSWRMAADVVVLHHHALDGEMEQDATFHKTYDDFFKGTSRDQSVFELFMKHDFETCVKKIMEFQDYIPGQQHNPVVTNER